MISDIRSYFNRTIRKIDSDLKHDGSADLSKAISLTQLDRIYKLEFGDIEPVLQDTSFLTIIPVTLVIFKRLKTDETGSFDKALCKAIDIHTLIQNKLEFADFPIIRNITCNSIKPESIDDDDKAYQFTLEFIVTTAYKF